MAKLRGLVLVLNFYSALVDASVATQVVIWIAFSTLGTTVCALSTSRIAAFALESRYIIPKRALSQALTVEE